MFTYLSMIVGPQSGTNYLLDSGRETRIGRGVDCDIVLDDPLSSRVHAIVRTRSGDWWVYDSSSRNGTFVNGQKIDEARLIAGSVVRIGTSEFSLLLSDTRLSNEVAPAVNLLQTVIRDMPVSAQDTGSFIVAAVRDADRSRDLMVLFQLSITLLACSDPDEVVRISLTLLRETTLASMVGFLWVSDEGELRPKQVHPEGAAEHAKLSESLTEAVLKKGHAVWVANETAHGSASLSHFADAMCVPLLHDKTTLGAIHLYLEHGRFRQPHFDFAVSLANILTVALVRARQQASLVADHDRLVAKSAGFDELVGESKPIA